MCPGQFLENGWKKQNAIYRDSSTAQAEFKSTNKSKIGSLYMEIFQHKGTVPNAQRSRVLGLQSQNWPSKPAKTLYKVYIFRIYVTRAIQNSIIYTRSDKLKVTATRTQSSCQTLLEVKSRESLLANFSKTAEPKKPLSAVCSTAWDTHHIQKWAQSVHSSRSYSNYKVPYQMVKKARWPPFRAKIDNVNYIKSHTKYIWGYSPLTEDSKTLTLVG